MSTRRKTLKVVSQDDI